ncbi:fumarylacetoacetate hydrolase family protein [Acidiplasma cupricumulans]|uniref:fumarylacetoacetate hydrolase family protein n=1 Tax=Acidiplasma cupricumulans TaxID=312540 RepID=UPI0007819336|nr:fumarylacetoacetate hydrolase family protein [Acidiplasma cupricumulans]
MDELISYISKYITLMPGDVISTGTPSGVILGMPEDKRIWIKPGDNVTVKIDKIGELKTHLWNKNYVLYINSKAWIKNKAQGNIIKEKN